jgi:hypothetical protein
MTPQRLDVWIWVLIFGGLLAVGLGLAIERRSSALGWTVVVVGAVVALVGAVLVWVRSRTRAEEPE